MSDFITVFIVGILALAVLKELIPIVVRLLDYLLLLPFRLAASAARRSVLAGPQLGPYERNRKRAVTAAFVVTFSVYLVRGGSWPLDQSPPSVVTALTVIAALSFLFLLAGLHGARNGPRDAFGVVAALTVAGGAGFLLWGGWYLPPQTPGGAADYVNPLLPGFYLAVLVAACLRALICVQLLGGAQRVIARALRRRAMGMRPVSASASGFWADMRESFRRGRDGRPWRD